MAGATLAVATGSNPSLTASLTVPTVTGIGFVPGTVQTNRAVTCDVVGGTPPYTYLWTYVSGDASVYPNNATSNTTRFSRYITTETSYASVWKCTVTDAAATNDDSGNLDITLEGFS